MGWLKEANIELISVVSLGESMQLYNSGSSDVFMGTQHEFQKQREDHSDLIPVMLMDRSNGGDAIMSNRTIDQLKNSKKKIDVFLELDSINEDVLNSFILEHKLSKEQMQIHNRVQDEIKVMKNTPSSSAIIIVTYDPYNAALEKNGFKEIATTRDSNSLFVVDAMYLSSELFYENKEQFKQLDGIINRSLDVLNKDPKEYYSKVKPYLDNPTYEEFLHINANIEWIHKNVSPIVDKQLEKIDFPTKDIIK